MPLAAADILRELVAIPSVSALSNIPMLQAATTLLEGHGWVVQRMPLLSENGTEKANLLAVPAQFADARPELDLLFVCHTDTVPYRSDWTSATRLQEDGEMLRGCGACDVKGSLAGLLAAAQNVETAALKMRVGFALTADEEIGCIGAMRLVESGAVRPQRVIVCEPTSLRPATAGKGYGLAEVRVRGQEAHSAFPDNGVSAIGIAARLIVRIEEMARASGQLTDGRFYPPCTTFNVGVLRGGTAKNIIAGECTFLVEWRPLPQEDASAGGEAVRRLAAEMEYVHSGCAIEMTQLRAEGGFSNAPSSKLGRALSEMLGAPETGISFGSEATRFAAIAEEVVVMGPGDMETAHSERECVSRIELERWTSIVQHLLVHGCEAAG